MTAEIAILNKSGIVLASDSASTIGGNKVYNSAKKLFTLSTEHSIGIMVYGNAEFMGVPWEIIVSQYRKKIGTTVHSTFNEYHSSFINFLDNLEFLKEQNLQDNYVFSHAQQVIMAIFQSTESDVNFLISNGQQVENKMFINFLETAISNIKNDFKYSEPIIDIKDTAFEDKYGNQIKEILYSVSTYPEVSNGILNSVIDLVYYTIIRDNSFLPSTGIVIAGYGDSEIFPSLKSFNLYGFLMNKLKYSLHKDAYISTQDGGLHATIIPFAQDDVVNTVVQGIDPQLSTFLASKTVEFSDDGRKKYEEIINELSFIQQRHYIEPLLGMIGLLPVDETAVIAETLLNLTSFKRKYTTSVETVGGPIDVLSITPNEGPIWIKRKHYFNLEDNLGYRTRREDHAKRGTEK